MGLINVLAEFERMGWVYEASGEDHVKCRCPFHEDESPSCSVNIREGKFSCKAGACGAKGDILTFLARALRVERGTVYADLAKRYDLEQVKIIEPSVIEDCHTAIWSQPHLLKELYLRAIEDTDIREHRLGFMRNRITIPIKNTSGLYVNIKYYLPGGPSANKMLNAKYRGKNRLFMPEQLKYDKIVLCGGELKAILTKRIMNPHGFGAVSPTGGEGNWDHSLTSFFKGKHVYIMLDVDESGKKGAKKWAQILKVVATSVHIVELPLDVEKYPHGDVNDFIAAEHGDLPPVITSAQEWTPPTHAPKFSGDEEPLALRFSETTNSDNVGRRMRFPGMIAMTRDAPFIVPKVVASFCDRSQTFCPVCPIFPQADETEHSIQSESPVILQMVEVNAENIDKAIKNALGVPQRCNAVHFEVRQHYNAEDVRIGPSIDITSRDSNKAMQQAIIIDCETELNVNSEFTGRMYPHPKTQQSTLVLSASKATADSLDTYEPQRLDELQLFRPTAWTAASIHAKLDTLYADLEANVTKIFMRRDIHLLVDLAYHSPLLVTVDGKVTKGWVETAIIGDSSQGKSETFVSLRQHYGLGERVDCKNATVAGLLGGLKQMGTAWFVAWGVIPCNDRKLVCLEEAKGLRHEDIGSMTDMRSSGVAEIPKIEKRRTQSRARLIWVSNPRENRTVSSYSFGVEAIRDLMGAPEDLRRLDLAMVVSAEDVSPRDINDIVRNPPIIEHVHEADLCRELILWAWTRRVNQVVVEPEAQEHISAESSRLCDRYSPLIPLIDGGSTRHKISRLATALAARTFSASEDDSTILVRKCHAEYIVDLIERLYNSKNFGYNHYSDSVKAHDNLLDPEAIASFMQTFEHPNEVKNHLLYSDEFDLIDIQDWCSWERDNAQRFLSLLVRKRAVKRGDRNKYHKTANFITWLKKTELAERPKHIQEDSKPQDTI
jgi:hypothetical protein